MKNHFIELNEANFDREVLNATQPVPCEVRNQLCHQVHYLSLSFPNKPPTGDLVPRLIRCVGLLQGLVVPMRAKALILVGMFALMFCLNWRLALVALLAPFGCRILWHENAAAQHRAATFSSGNQHLPLTLAETKALAQVQRRRLLQATRLQRSSPSEAHSLKLTASAKVHANLARH